MILKKHEQQSNLPTSRNTRYTHQPHFYQHSTRPFQATQYQRSLMPKDPSKLVRWLCLDRTALWGDTMFESGHTRIFHPPRFPWNFRGFPLLNHYLGGQVVWGRYNLTRLNQIVVLFLVFVDWLFLLVAVIFFWENSIGHNSKRLMDLGQNNFIKHYIWLTLHIQHAFPTTKLCEVNRNPDQIKMSQDFCFVQVAPKGQSKGSCFHFAGFLVIRKSIYGGFLKWWYPKMDGL